MTIAKLQKICREGDYDAGNAFVIGDSRLEEQWLDARNAIGKILRDRDYQAWNVLRPQRQPKAA